MPTLLDTQEYADLHDVSRRTVQRWVSDGLIFGITIGRTTYIDSEEESPSQSFRSGESNSDIEPLKLEANFLGGESEVSDRYHGSGGNDFGPEDVDDIEDEEGECRDQDEFERKDLRKSYQTREEAENYASGIPISTIVFRRCSDNRFQVAIEY